MRLIDADALKERFKSVDANGISLVLDRYALKCIDDAPTIDAVEVVRCKHCRRWLNGDDTYGTCRWNEYQTLQTRYDDYCSYGERK